MGRKSKVLTLPLPKRKLKNSRKILHARSIKPVTLQQYRSRLEVVLSRVSKLEGKKVLLADLSPTMFEDFLISLDDKISDADSFRSAILHHQMAEGLPEWASSSPVKKSVTGFEYNAGMPRSLKARGAITRAMVSEAIQKVHKDLQLPLRVIFFCALRKWEYILLRKGNKKGNKLSINMINEKGENMNKQYSTRSFKSKKNKELMKQPEVMQKDLVCPEAIEALDEAEQGVAEGHFLFPYCTASQKKRKQAPDRNWDTIQATIKQLKIDLAWPECLDFCCHSLRHGGIQNIERQLDSDSFPSNPNKEELLHRATGNTARARKIYLKDNEKRIAGQKRKRSISQTK